MNTELKLAWITDPDAPYHLTTSDENTFKTLCGRKGWKYNMGDNTRIWNASCQNCCKKAQRAGA